MSCYSGTYPFFPNLNTTLTQNPLTLQISLKTQCLAACPQSICGFRTKLSSQKNSFPPQPPPVGTEPIQCKETAHHSKAVLSKKGLTWRLWSRSMKSTAGCNYQTSHAYEGSTCRLNLAGFIHKRRLTSVPCEQRSPLVGRRPSGPAPRKAY